MGASGPWGCLHLSQVIQFGAGGARRSLPERRAVSDLERHSPLLPPPRPDTFRCTVQGSFRVQEQTATSQIISRELRSYGDKEPLIMGASISQAGKMADDVDTLQMRTESLGSHVTSSC